MQENIQSLIILYFFGACIGIIVLRILWNNVSLETKKLKARILYVFDIF